MRNRFFLIFGKTACSSILSLLNFFADRITVQEFIKSKNPCPNYNSSFFNRISYHWCTLLIYQGFRKPFVITDLWDISPQIASCNVVPDFEKNYKAEKEKKAKVPVAKFSNISDEVNLNGSQQFSLSKISILPVLIRTYGASFLFGAFIKICGDLLNLASPKVMKLIIRFVESNNVESPEPPEQKWKGLLYAGLLFFIMNLQSVLIAQHFERMLVIGLQIRTALVSTLFKKSLRISAAAKKNSTVGEIVNLISVDVQKLMELTRFINVLWSAILQIGLATFFIYQELDWPAFVGVGILLVSVPLNGWLAGFMRRLQVRVMKLKDKRIKLMSEILSGIKVLKLFAWEPSFIQRVDNIRNKEIQLMKKAAYFNAFMSFFFNTAPFLVGLGAFSTFIFFYDGGQSLTASNAFVTLSYLNLMRMPLAMLPMVVQAMVQAKVSLDRINKFLNNNELACDAVSHETGGAAVEVRGGTFKWDPADPPVLRDIQLSVPAGALTAVVGSVGCGKSSLMAALLGELHKEAGTVNTGGRIAYVPQQAWIQNCTLRQNILFCEPEGEERYRSVIESCALATDLEMLPAGDQTEIGEKGINLSGGQKQRVSLARAVYSQADIYLLDDPLSAVDSHVGKHIFERVLGPNGLLAGKTRILVTHGLNYLPRTDYIVVIKEGRISEQGNYQELLQQEGEFAAFMQQFCTKNQKIEICKENQQKSNGQETELYITQPCKPKQASVWPKIIKENIKVPFTPSDKLIEKEEVMTGSVSFKVYLHYMQSLGMAGGLMALLGQTLVTSSSYMASYWVSLWTSNKYGNASLPANRDLYLGVYGGIGLFQSLVLMAHSAVLSVTTLNAARALHNKMLSRVMASPMIFFDRTPLGRILNRFAKDVDVCDTTLPSNFRSWLGFFARFVATLITITMVAPLFILVILPVSVIFYFVQTFYVRTSRQLKRLESTTRSPIYSHYGETVTGASVIRAFSKQKDFVRQSEAHVDTNQRAAYPSIIANRWLVVRLKMLGSILTLGAAMFVILNPSAFSAGQVGLIITYSLGITQILNQLVQLTASVETNIVGVERMVEYSQLEQEAAWLVEQPRPDQDWPDRGQVEFTGYGLRYRAGLKLVLHNITVKVEAGEKVGIVGRTGAGKSTLTSALFRLVEPAEGGILIDGQDISQLGLHHLRGKMTIIPQDPVLFSGSLRMNLDPFNAYSDQEVWTALERAHIRQFLSERGAGLQLELTEGGENLSVGQRQLICLARTLLRKTRILIMDEATAAVDLETDLLIQATIRKEFAKSTVLTIAHRLDTVLNYDKILVLERGRLVECDTPANLLANSATIFHRMAQDAGLNVCAVN